jgi:hypothetical protein
MLRAFYPIRPTPVRTHECPTQSRENGRKLACVSEATFTNTFTKVFLANDDP